MHIRLTMHADDLPLMELDYRLEGEELAAMAYQPAPHTDNPLELSNWDNRATHARKLRDALAGILAMGLHRALTPPTE